MVNAKAWRNQHQVSISKPSGAGGHGEADVESWLELDNTDPCVPQIWTLSRGLGEHPGGLKSGKACN